MRKKVCMEFNKTGYSQWKILKFIFLCPQSATLEHVYVSSIIYSGLTWADIERHPSGSPSSMSVPALYTTTSGWNSFSAPFTCLKNHIYCFLIWLSFELGSPHKTSFVPFVRVCMQHEWKYQILLALQWQTEVQQLQLLQTITCNQNIMLYCYDR